MQAKSDTSEIKEKKKRLSEIKKNVITKKLYS